MSDTSQGPGWWRASNGLWYPPEATPGPREPRPSTGDSGRRPPGVPERPPADPKVQPPFTPRPLEPLELEREHARLRDRRRQEDDDPRRRVRWGWVGVALLVLAFGGLGTWLALTAGDTADDDAGPGTTTPTTAAATTSTAAPTTSTTDDSVSVFTLAAGDCFVTTDEPDDGEGDDVVLRTVELVDCDEPHLAEVVAVTTFPDPPGAPFPGAAARDRTAQELCTPEFERYVGVALAESSLGLVWLSPTEATWTDDDDREVTCAAQAVDGEPLVGSVAGSGR